MHPQSSEEKKVGLVLKRKNYLILLAGFVLIITGYLLMSGKGSTLVAYNPDIFNKLRIHVAPLLCLIGYTLHIVGILKR